MFAKVLACDTGDHCQINKKYHYQWLKNEPDHPDHPPPQKKKKDVKEILKNHGFQQEFVKPKVSMKRTWINSSLIEAPQVLRDAKASAFRAAVRADTACLMVAVLEEAEDCAKCSLAVQAIFAPQKLDVFLDLVQLIDFFVGKSQQSNCE